MKLYPLYEFPPSLDVLEKILTIVDQQQPIAIYDFKEIVGSIIGKRPSRTYITIKELKKLKIIEGDEKFHLSWETQLYIDFKRDLSDLLLYLVYNKSELFDICYFICEIDPEHRLSRSSLYRELACNGFNDDKETTAKEKLFGILRLVKACQKGNKNNPFKIYKDYIQFLKDLESIYLEVNSSQYNKNTPIYDLEKMMTSKGKIHHDTFGFYLNKLYKDPIYSSYTSFSTVIKEFANKKYFKVGVEEYYYFKLRKTFFDNFSKGE